jgi:hypothetical protein
VSFDVFISYSTKDTTAAKAACAALEAAKIRCWMAPRDIMPGARWGASIVRAINECRVMVLIFSGNANASAQVHREVDQAFGKGRAVLPLRIEDVRPADGLAYYLDTVHWLDALTPPLETNLEKLVATVQALLPTTEASPQSAEPFVDDAQAAQAQDEARAEDERREKNIEAGQGTAEQTQRDQEAAAARLLAEEDAKRRAEAEARSQREEAEAKERVEAERAFANAKSADSAAALDAFLAAYPASHLIAEARALRAALAERDEAYKRAMASDDAAVLKAFLDRYQNGKPADDVRKRLRRVERPKGNLSRRVGLIGGGIVAAAVGAATWFVVASPQFVASPQHIQTPTRAGTLRLDGYYGFNFSTGGDHEGHIRFFADGTLVWGAEFAAADQTYLSKGNPQTWTGTYEVIGNEVKLSTTNNHQDFTGTIESNGFSLTDANGSTSYFVFHPW